MKGQAIPAWDPRPLKATGLTYCTSPMGADHTAGLIVNPGMPEEEWVRASQEGRARGLDLHIDIQGFSRIVKEMR